MRCIISKIRVKLTLIVVSLLCWTGWPAAHAADASLPYADAVAATETSAIDGIWRLTVNGARVRINRGRMIAMDPWTHLLLWRVQKDMVVSRDIRQTSANSWSANDILLAAPATLTLTREGVLNGVTRGLLGPASYNFELLEADFPAQLIAAQVGRLPPPPKLPGPPPELTDPGSTVDPVETGPNPPSQPVTSPYPEVPPASVVQPDLPPRGCEPIGTDPDTGMTICS